MRFSFLPPSANGVGSAPAFGRHETVSQENPWVEAIARGRAEFAGAFGDLAKAKRNWQLAAFGALGLAGIMGLGFYTLATQAHITPYVVQVDRLGRAQAFGPAERTSLADQRVVVGEVATWVHNIRTVSADPLSQKDMVENAYAFVDANVATFLQSYFTDPTRDPRTLASEFSRVVQVTSVLPLPGAVGRGGKVAANAPVTWKVAWTETDYPRGGGTPLAAGWEGYIATRVVPPKSEDHIQLNPLGLYVSSVNWTQVTPRQPLVTLGAGGLPMPGAPSGPAPASTGTFTGPTTPGVTTLAPAASSLATGATP